MTENTIEHDESRRNEEIKVKKIGKFKYVERSDGANKRGLKDYNWVQEI